MDQAPPVPGPESNNHVSELLLHPDDALDFPALWPDNMVAAGSIYWPFGASPPPPQLDRTDSIWDLINYPVNQDNASVAWHVPSTPIMSQAGQDQLPTEFVHDMGTDSFTQLYVPDLQHDKDDELNKPVSDRVATPAGVSQLVISRKSGTAGNDNDRNGGQQLSISRSVTDDSSVLVAYYFKDTAQIFSCYDGNLNPFRKTISSLWASSPLIYHSLSSMAAASLDQTFPQYKSVGRDHRREAIKLIEQDTPVDETTLLALLMLGGTASWHNPRDIGTRFFNMLARRLERLRNNGHFNQDATNFRFFQEAMIYWEMLLAYVVDGSDLDQTAGSTMIQDEPSCRKMPHPWTGIARETQYLVQEVGRLVRQQRKRARLHRFMTQAHIKEMQRALRHAEDLEGRLLATSHDRPQKGDAINPEDCETPLWHLFTLADIYRCTGLVQLYRVFPDLLHAKVFSHGDTATLNHEHMSRSMPVATPRSDADADDLPTGLLSSLATQWLCAYTVKAVELLRTIPLESGTRDFQPFLLVALSSELRIDPVISSEGCLPEESELDTNQARQHDTNVVSPCIQAPSPESLPVIRARGLIMSRLKSYLHILPPRPIHVCIDIVRTAWAQMDEASVRRAAKAKALEDGVESFDDGEGGESESVEVYWLDVMMENGWETTMA